MKTNHEHPTGANTTASEEQRERVMRLWKNAPEFERGRIIGKLEALAEKQQEQKSA